MTCYEYHCDEENKLFVYFNEKKFECTSEVKELTIEGYFGKINCPADPKAVCASFINCYKYCN